MTTIHTVRGLIFNGPDLSSGDIDVRVSHDNIGSCLSLTDNNVMIMIDLENKELKKRLLQVLTEAPDRNGALDKFESLRRKDNE